MIPIFDTTTHPTIDGTWLHSRYDGTAFVGQFIRNMDQTGVIGCFAIGMDGIGQYNEDEYIRMVKECGDNRFLPIAYFNFTNLSRQAISARLYEIKAKGYCGVKLHPRFSGFTIDNPLLPYVIDKANELHLIPLLCTYFPCSYQSQRKNNIETLGDMMMQISFDSSLILLHGGLTRLLDTMELVRFFPNVILDLSLTMCKYEGSSIDLDVEYIFKWFDRRTCLGTDSPEISHRQLRKRVDELEQITTDEKVRNIAYRNIFRLLDKFGIQHTMIE